MAFETAFSRYRVIFGLSFVFLMVKSVLIVDNMADEVERPGQPHVLPPLPVTPTDLRTPGIGTNSPVIAISPIEKQFVAIASRTDGAGPNCRLEVSGDGGRIFVPAYPVAELPVGVDRCYGPDIAFDGYGVLYYLFVGLQGRGNAPEGVYLTTSSDYGRTFTSAQRLLGPDNYQPRMIIDALANSTGRLYLVWLHSTLPAPLGGLPNGLNPILLAYSDDAGNTMSSPVQVNDESRSRVVAPTIALGSKHEIHIVYYDLRTDARDYQGLQGAPWTEPWSLILATSTDRGVTIAPGVVVDDAIRPPGRVFLIFTMGPAALTADGSGRLHVAWTDARNGDWDVLLRTTTNDGLTWSDARRVNDDLQGNGRHQYLPQLSLSSNGRLDVLFFDRRNSAANDFADAYYAYSADGYNFEANLRITPVSFDSRIGATYAIPSAEGLVEPGSRLGLAAQDSRAVLAWSDTGNAYSPGVLQQDIVATRVSFKRSLGTELLSGVLIASFVGLLLGVAVRRMRRRTG